jgi:hypothetical protein
MPPPGDESCQEENMQTKNRHRLGRAPHGTLSNWVIPAMAAAIAVGAVVLRNLV